VWQRDIKQMIPYMIKNCCLITEILRGHYRSTKALSSVHKYFRNSRDPNKIHRKLSVTRWSGCYNAITIVVPIQFSSSNDEHYHVHEKYKTYLNHNYMQLLIVWICMCNFCTNSVSFWSLYDNTKQKILCYHINIYIDEIFY